jgi:YidC/Oxa1 family membrane protein insertase
MDLFQTILWPLEWLVEFILVIWHQLFTWVGLNPAGGLNWVLSIAGLVVVVRAALIPIFVRQIKAQRRMLEMAPDLKKVQEKYKGKKDQFSREAMSRETMELYKKHGTNPFSSCLPILIQMPIFFSLFYVLQTASNSEAGVGFMNAELAANFSAATVFGAPLSMTFLEAWNNGGPWQVLVIATLLVVIMTASQFFTQLQIMSKNVSEETKNSPMFKQQRILLYVIPFMFVFSGVAFPLGLNFYWFASNLWTMAQQFIVIRQMPTPGSEAHRMREERLAKKNKNRTAAAELDSAEPVEEENSGTQRQQPVSSKRAKKQQKKPKKR